MESRKALHIFLGGLKVDKRDIINMVYTIPYRIGHKVGFTKLNGLTNQWILEMIKGVEDHTLQAHRQSY